MSNQQNSPVEEMESLSGSNSSSRDPLLDTSSHALLPTDAHAFIERYGLKEDDYEIFEQAATDLFLLSSDPDSHDSTTITTTTTTTRLLPDARNTNPIPNNPRKPESHPKTKWHHPLPLYLIVLALCLGAMSQGWSQASINGANLYYPQDFHLDNNSSTTHNTLIIGIINAAIYLSNGLIGSWLVAPLNARYGRRGATFLGGAICVVMNFLSGWSSSSWEALLGFRLLLGVGLGVVSSSLNVFAAEVAPAQIRGALAVGWQMFCAGGIFVGLGWNLVVDQYWGDYYWGQEEEEEEHEAGMRWRVMLMAGAVPAVVLIVLIWWCPESPAWYVKHGEQYGKAFDSLCRIRNSKLEAARELLLAHQQQQKRPSRTNTTTTTAIQHDDDDSKNSCSSFRQTFFELYTVPRLRRATIAAYTVMLSQQLCGINIIAFYSSNIFVSAHFSPFAAELASTIFGLCNFLGALPAIFTMDTFGRRSLLLYTLPLMGLTLACTSFTFSFSSSSSSSSSPSTTDPPHKQNFPLLTTSLIYIFCLLYSPGMGPVPAIYSAEVFPLSHREIGTSSSVAVTNLFAAILSLTFPYLLARMGTQGSFMLYAILNLVAWGLVFVLVPETKQLTLEKGLEEVFEQPTREFVRGKVRRCAFWGR